MNSQTHGGCVSAALAVIGGKWKAPILYAIGEGTIRFGELRRKVRGISEKMLVVCLRELRADGIVDRRDFHEIPLRVEYALTQHGHSLTQILIPLSEWGDAHVNRAQDNIAISGVIDEPVLPIAQPAER